MSTQKEPSSTAFKKWLDLLQQESWQLELIISGFSIFGLFQLIDPILETNAIIMSEDKQVLSLLLLGLFLAVSLCILNLCIHVVLRGLWVGALGLRYVSGEIEFDQLDYHKWFDRFLRKRIKSFDHFISKLENYCSIMFAIAFLSIFFILSFFFVLGILIFASTALNNGDMPDWLENTVGVIVLLVLIAMLLTFLDFLTLGFFKRKRWIAVWYYPIYRVYSAISLSFLYRPLVYNFLDSKFSRRIFMLLFPIYAILLAGVSIKYQGSNYFLTNDINNTINIRSPFIASNSHYEDQLETKKDLVKNYSIPSKYVSTNALPFFILYKENIEEDLVKIYPELSVKEDMKGMEMKGFVRVSINDYSENFDKLSIYLDKLKDLYELKIDSVSYINDFIVSKNRKEQMGFETMLDLHNLKKGKHILNVSRKTIRTIAIPKDERTDSKVKERDSIYTRELAAIPFWYYPD